MLGSKISEEMGRVVVERVLQSDRAPQVETSFQTVGILLGVPTKGIGTYTATLREDGTLFGEAQGMDMGPGGEMTSWKGQGVGLLTPGGGATFRGAIYYTSRSQPWLALNRIAAIYHWEVDAYGNVRGELYEWR